MSEDKNTRFYELGYLFVPTVAETETGKEVATLKSTIASAGGTVHSEGSPEYIDLAYTMERTVGSKKYKYSQGYFGWIKFDTDPESIAAITKVLDGNLSVIRYILVKTNVENTVVFKKPKVDAKRETALSDEEMQALIAASEAEAAEEEVEEVKAAHEKLPELEVDSTDAATASDEA